LFNITDLVILYLKRHANKACCFTDLKEYLALLTEEGKQTITSWLDSQYSTRDIDVSVRQACNASSPSKAKLIVVPLQTLQSMECSMTVEKIRRYLQGRYGSIEEELQRGHRLAAAYFASLHFGKFSDSSTLSTSI
jgi:hypothetical protein